MASATRYGSASSPTTLWFSRYSPAHSRPAGVATADRQRSSAAGPSTSASAGNGSPREVSAISAG